MDIWDSYALMTAVDLAIVAAASIAVGSIWSRRNDFKRLKLSGPITVLAGLLLLTIIFLIDLAVMWLMPFFAEASVVDATMHQLHAQSTWLFLPICAVLLCVGIVSTVRQLRRAEDDLADRERLFGDIVGSQTEFIVRWKPDGTRTFVNEAYCRYFEQSAEELIGTSFMPLVAPEYRQAIEEKIAGLTPEHPTAVGTHEVLRPDGSRGWQEWVDTGFFDERGELVDLQSVGRDVSERRLAERAVRASEARYRAIFDATTSGLVIRRLRDGELVDLNKAMAGFHGYSRAELLEMPMEDYVPAESLARFRRDLGKLNSSEPTPTEGQGIHRDGHLFDLEGFFVPFDFLGEPHVLGVLDDVTQRNRAEAALRASEEKFARAFQASPDPMLITSLADGSLIDGNSSFLEAAGLSREEAIGKTTGELELWPEPGTFGELLEAWRRDEDPGRREVTIRTAPGEERIVELSGARFEMDGEPCLLTSARDFTERRRAEDQLRRQLDFESRVAELSGRLVHLAEGALDEQLGDALAALIDDREIDRASVFEFDEQGRCPLTHSQVAAGLEPHPPADLADLPWIVERLRLGEVILYSQPSDLPEEAAALRGWIEAQGDRPIAALPLQVGSTVLGCLSLRASQEGYEWSERALRRIRLIADLVANALARRSADREIRQSEARYRKAFEEVARLKEELERERDYLREEVTRTGRFGDIIGESDSLAQVLERIEAVAATDTSVLIQGESGVGKELVAREIHASSSRRDGPLVRVNCPAVPRELFESEFFGHVQGAFTGAHRDRVGRFELADGGTIFLDEVSEIPIELQAKLLRVLQEGEFQRVGEERTRTVDVRVLAASNRGLKLEMAAGRFREDLYYRLSAFPIKVPPLRERREDILPLARHFVALACEELRRPTLPISRFQAQQLLDHDWPGNVRELQNVITQAVILSPGERLRLDLVMAGAPAPALKARTADVAPLPDEKSPPFLTAEEFKRRERDNIVAALEHAAWKISGAGGAADLLGLKPSTLSYQIKAMGIRRPPSENDKA